MVKKKNNINNVITPLKDDSVALEKLNNDYFNKEALNKGSSFNVGDIETVLFQGHHLVVAICIKIEQIRYVKFLKINSNKLANFTLDSLQKACNNIIVEILDTIFNSMISNEIVIYFHNMSNFDGIFIINACVSKYHVKIIMRNNIIYEISLSTQTKKIIIRDSYHLVPFSLEKAASSLNDENIRKMD